jgi:hypothetical protein
MSREIRRTPVGWVPPPYPNPYPTWGRNSHDWTGNGVWYQPQHDRTLREAQADWDHRKAAWDSGEDPDRARYTDKADDDYPFEDWAGERPEDGSYYRPEWPEGVELGYQLYESVTEGTPVSPSFATVEELARYLTHEARMFDSTEAAMRFIGVGWAPTGVQYNDGSVEPGYKAVARDAESGTR